jgi:beta-N-acetylhexosaminidase
MTKAFISGCAGLELTPEEREFFREQDPWGLILFRRNIDTPAQVKALCEDFRRCVRRSDAPILVDQEGGRVQRLGPPYWPAYPPGSVYGEVYNNDREKGRHAARLGARLIAHDLLSLGITVNCLPLLDLRLPETTDIIGDRSYSSDPEEVADIGRAVCDGLLEGGVLPVIKHLPGHGRALVDSHLELPRISATGKEMSGSDFKAFAALSDIALAMTAHILYEDLDASAPATQSPQVIKDVIRGELGFNGCLMSDDISMKALDGEMSDRALASYAAGCDLVLHCNGDMAEMAAVAAAAPVLTGLPLERCERALSERKPAAPFDEAKARADFASLIAGDKPNGV